MNKENKNYIDKENELNTYFNFYKNNKFQNKGTINNKILYDYNKYIFYKSFVYKYIKCDTKNYKKKNINKKIYKYIYYRKKERARKKVKLGQFCTISIHCSYKEVNDFSTYFYEIKINHSEEYIVFKNREINVKIDTINENDIFKNKIFVLLNKEIDLINMPF